MRTKSILAASLFCFACHATSSGSSFEVASFRLHTARGGQISLSTSGTRLNAEAKTVATLIMYAWNVQSYQVPDSPALHPFGDLFYDIAAKAEGDATPSAVEFRQMVPTLLAERFKLQVHRETREVPVYALVTGRGGPRLKASLPAADPTPRYSVTGRNYEVTMPGGTMDDVIRAIENSLVDRPILDKTGLTAAYEISLTYTPNTPANRGLSDPDDVTIFAAVQKLGLRLEPQKAVMEVLVVDHLEKPSEN